MRVTNYYPVFLDISDKHCVVIGGGRVAARKAKGLLECGARVTVVGPTIGKGLVKLAATENLELIQRDYRSDDLENAMAVVAATDNRELNRQISVDANQRNILVNVVDDPELCSFIVPARLKKGALTLAISTEGVAPLAARRLKEEAKQLLDADYSRYVKIVGAFRSLLMARTKNKVERARIMKALGEMEIKEVTNLGIKALKHRLLDSQE